MTAKANGKSYFQIDNGGNPEQYLNQKREEIETMTSREQMVARSVLLIAETIVLVLNQRDTQVLQIMREEIDQLFLQAEDILKHGTHNVQ